MWLIGVCLAQVSDTYPAELYVPESATQQVIVGSSKFRSRGRFPTLSYYCKDNQVRPAVGSIPLHIHFHRYFILVKHLYCLAMLGKWNHIQ